MDNQNSKIQTTILFYPTDQGGDQIRDLKLGYTGHINLTIYASIVIVQNILDNLGFLYAEENFEGEPILNININTTMIPMTESVIYTAIIKELSKNENLRFEIQEDY